MQDWGKMATHLSTNYVYLNKYMWTGTAIASSSRPSGYCGCCTDFPATKKQKKEIKVTPAA